ncbi:hypothetical protein EDB19DRAFT_2026390 [Suillus lakei]|nr:hypothetical protein EDB19DRAFT_2026390 [Suillus lakei]
MSGVSHVKQMTGREHCDIQRTIVPTMWGTVNPAFIRAVRTMIDFIYLAQHPVHTEASIKAMSAALSEFHDHKQAILDAEARRGKGGAKEDFFIPKLELMQSFTRAITHAGSLIQYSADVSERLLITHCKHPFEKTSRQKDFVQQITRILDREETIRLFELYTLLASSPVSASGCGSDDPLINAVFAEDDEVAGPEVDPALAWISRVNPDAQQRLHAPRPVHNHFLKGIMFDDARIAFNITINPDRKRLTVIELQSLYGIVDFSQALHYYFTKYCEAVICCIVGTVLMQYSYQPETIATLQHGFNGRSTKISRGFLEQHENTDLIPKLLEKDLKNGGCCHLLIAVSKAEQRLAKYCKHGDDPVDVKFESLLDDPDDVSKAPDRVYEQHSLSSRNINHKSK